MPGALFRFWRAKSKGKLKQRIEKYFEDINAIPWYSDASINWMKSQSNYCYALFRERSTRNLIRFIKCVEPIFLSKKCRSNSLLKYPDNDVSVAKVMKVTDGIGIFMEHAAPSHSLGRIAAEV